VFLSILKVLKHLRGVFEFILPKSKPFVLSLSKVLLSSRKKKVES